MSKKILHLNLKKIYFEEIKSGKKKFEYRLKTKFWEKRLVDKMYDEVHIKCGYPRSTDTDRIIAKPYFGYEETTITHPHFGNESVDAFAIVVN